MIEASNKKKKDNHPLRRTEVQSDNIEQRQRDWLMEKSNNQA